MLFSVGCTWLPYILRRQRRRTKYMVPGVIIYVYSLMTNQTHNECTKILRYQSQSIVAAYCTVVISQTVLCTTGASAQGGRGAAAPPKKLGRGRRPPPQTKKHRKAQKNDESALRAKEVIWAVLSDNAPSGEHEFF